MQPAPDRVVIYDYKFNPPRLTVAAGTKVTWVNMDLIHHTATGAFEAEPFD
jgi:plastocyanin